MIFNRKLTLQENKLSLDISEVHQLNESAQLYLDMAQECYDEYGDREALCEGVSDFMKVTIDAIKKLLDKIVEYFKKLLDKISYKFKDKRKYLKHVAKTLHEYDVEINVPYIEMPDDIIIKSYPDLSAVSKGPMLLADKVSELEDEDKAIRDWFDDVSIETDATAHEVLRGRILGKTFVINKATFRDACDDVFCNKTSNMKKKIIGRNDIGAIADRYINLPDIIEANKKEAKTIDSYFKEYIRYAQRHSAFKKPHVSKDEVYYIIDRKKFKAESGDKIFKGLKMILKDLNEKVSMFQTAFISKLEALELDTVQCTKIIETYAKKAEIIA